MAQRVCPDRKSLPDRKRSAKVSTVGRREPKTRICPSKNASLAFIVQFHFFQAKNGRRQPVVSLREPGVKAVGRLAPIDSQLMSYRPEHALEYQKNCGKCLCTHLKSKIPIKDCYATNSKYMPSCLVMVATLGCYLENAHANNRFRHNHPFPSCSRLNRLFIEFIT